MFKKLIKKLAPKTLGLLLFAVFAVIGMVLGIYYATSFFEPITENSVFTEPENARSKGDWHAYGRGWEPNASGSGSVELSSSTCEAAYGWYWFEDANGDGDTTDEEDGICVKATSTDPAVTPGLDTWNGSASTTLRDNSYIAAYTCTGNFPNGYVTNYSGIDIDGNTDAVYDDGDCALCQADCYDGKKDLPDQNGYIIPVKGYSGSGYYGPLNIDILKNWTGTRLPTNNDFYGFCGHKDAGDGYETNCSSDTTIGYKTNIVGRVDECIDNSYNGSEAEWLSGPISYCLAKAVYCCSYFSYLYITDQTHGFRAVFRP